MSRYPSFEQSDHKAKATDNRQVCMERSEIQEIRPSALERWVRKWCERWIVGRVEDPIIRQRLKLIWYVWGYWPILFLWNVSLGDRRRILGDFLRVDWNILHAHRPSEMSVLFRAPGGRVAQPGEVVVEAGCWRGGGSTKLSILCKMLGYRLCVYDSFEGVEVLPPREQAEEWNFGG